MAFITSHTDSPDCLTIMIRGRLDCHTVEKFRLHYVDTLGTFETYVIDFQDTQMIDSAALGSLLNLKDYAGDEASIILKNPNAMIYEILQVSQFSRMFSVVT